MSAWMNFAPLPLGRDAATLRPFGGGQTMASLVSERRGFQAEMCHGRLRCVTTNTCRTSDFAAAASDLTAAGLRLGGTGATTIAVGTDSGITAFISGATGSTAVATIPSATGAPVTAFLHCSLVAVNMSL
jgi:hypothetical protein